MHKPRAGDWRNRLSVQTAIDEALRQQFDTFRNDTTTQLLALVKKQDAIIAEQAAQLQALAARKQSIDLGTFTFTVGATLAVTLAGIKREVKPFAGVRPTDILSYTLGEYLSEGYGLPQIACRNAGQLEYRITVPALAIGVTKTITLGISALR